MRLAGLFGGIVVLIGAWMLLTSNPAAGGLQGSMFASGSSTVEPVTLLAAEELHALQEGFGFQVEGPGTGDGFALFCNGETDINNASRPIGDSEVDDCAEAGVDWVELLIAYDGLTVITSAENDAISCLSFLDLYALLGPESRGFGRWSDADALAAELEGALGDRYGSRHGPYPDGDLVVTAPGEESGTFDTFVELVIAPIADERGTEHTTRPDYVASPNDNVILEGISGTTTSLGWVGMAFAGEPSAEAFARQLEVDAGSGCVAPSDATVADGTYPISRPLFIYVNVDRADRNPALRAFVDYYLTDEGLAAAAEVGYVRLTDAQAAETRAAWDDALARAGR